MLLDQVFPPIRPDKHFKDWPNAGGFNALDERREKVPIVHTGKIPNYAAGTLLRTGPGGYKVLRDNKKDVAACDHWFDGWGTLHKFDLVPGPGGYLKEVKYQSRRQADEQILRARKTGKIEGITFGQKRDPCDSIFRKIKTMFAPQFPDGVEAVNIPVTFRDIMPQEVKHADGKSSHKNVMNVATDTSMTKQFDADTLEPIGIASQQVLHPKLNGQFSAAHSSKDPTTGDIFNYNLLLGPKPTYKIFRANPGTGETEILAEFSQDSEIKPAYLHALFCTENFVILCIWPSRYAMSGIKILWELNLMDAMEPWNPDNKAIWVVVDRHHGRGVVKKFTSPSFFAFHTTNAWEEKSEQGGSVNIFCELFEHKTNDVLKSLYYTNLASDQPGVEEARKKWDLSGALARYRLVDIPLTGEVSTTKPIAEKVLEMKGPLAGDLQGINPAWTFKKHRYVWGTLLARKSSFIDGLVKSDTETQTAITWEQDRHTPGEPIFVPAPDGKAEDDGVILTVVYNGDTGTSYLLCLDAQTMTEVGRAEVPIAVGFGFHGRHVPSAHF